MCGDLQLLNQRIHCLLLHSDETFVRRNDRVQRGGRRERAHSYRIESDYRACPESSGRPDGYRYDGVHSGEAARQVRDAASRHRAGRHRV